MVLIYRIFRCFFPYAYIDRLMMKMHIPTMYGMKSGNTDLGVMEDVENCINYLGGVIT